MKYYSVLLLLIILGFVSACDSPTRPFNNTNVNDPLSPRFKPGTNTDLQVLADSTGIITISWPEQIDIASKLILEKSLGDSLSYSPIAELSPETLVFLDSTLVVRQNTYYRLSSLADVSEGDEVLIESSQAKLDIGELFNLELEFVEEENTIRLSWQTSFPLFTHFLISSNKILSEQDEKTVRIEAEGINHNFTDPLLDIDFDTRSYTVTAVIEHDETEEEILEAGISFDVKTFFRPQGARIDVLNERDWKVMWRNAPFFATNVEVIRQKTGKPDVVYLLSPESDSFVDSLFIRQPDQSNEIRRYLIRYLTDELATEQITISYVLTLQPPIIDLSGSIHEDQSSFKLRWETPGFSANLVRDYIIESPASPNSQNFIEVGRVNGNLNEFTDTVTDINQARTYRVRSLTSSPSDAATFIYSNNYNPDYSFPTEMTFVTGMEVSADKRYMATVSFRAVPGNSIRIQDLVTGQHVNSISIPAQLISDIKISPDEQFIFFSVPTEGAIYRADFPSGENVEMIIEDASLDLIGVNRIDVSKDGSFIVGSGGFIFVKRWSLETFDLDFVYNTLTTPTLYPYKNIAISPDGAFIAAGAANPFIMDADSGEILHILDFISPDITDLQFSSDGNYFSYVDNYDGVNRVLIYSTETWQQLHTIQNVKRTASHPEEPILLVSGQDHVYTFDLETLREIDVISDQIGTGLSPSPSHSLSYIDDNTVAMVNFNSTIQLWKKTDGQNWKFIY